MRYIHVAESSLQAADDGWDAWTPPTPSTTTTTTTTTPAGSSRPRGASEEVSRFPGGRARPSRSSRPPREVVIPDLLHDEDDDLVPATRVRDEDFFPDSLGAVSQRENDNDDDDDDAELAYEEEDARESIRDRSRRGTRDERDVGSTDNQSPEGAVGEEGYRAFDDDWWLSRVTDQLFREGNSRSPSSPPPRTSSSSSSSSWSSSSWLYSASTSIGARRRARARSRLGLGDGTAFEDEDEDEDEDGNGNGNGNGDGDGESMWEEEEDPPRRSTKTRGTDRRTSSTTSSTSRPDVIPLSRSETEVVLPLAPLGTQVNYYTADTAGNIQRVGAGLLGAVVLSKVALLAAVSATFPLWVPWLLATARNAKVKKAPYVGLWTAEILDMEITDRAPGARTTFQDLVGESKSSSSRGRGRGRGRKDEEGRGLWVRIGDASGAETEIQVPLRRAYTRIRLGARAMVLVVASDQRFRRFRAVKDIYVPESGVWLAEYPFVDRGAFLSVMQQVERYREEEQVGGDEIGRAHV